MLANRRAPVECASNARIALCADPVRYVHPVRQLTRFLPNARFLAIDPLRLPAKLPAIAPEEADLWIVLIDNQSPGLASTSFISPGQLGSLREGGFILRTLEADGVPVICVAGGGKTGVVYGVNELGKKVDRFAHARFQIPCLDQLESPGLPYRLLWTWDHSTNWYLEQVGIQEIGAHNYYLKPKDGFLNDYTRLVDFMSENRIGGVTIYGFLRDNHGGIESAKQLCQYAAERGVRILPGVGINAYGGIYWEGEHRYNLTNWLKRNPGLRAVLGKPPAFHLPDVPQLWFPENQYTDAACPSKPENARFHQEAIQWLAETFPIGGVNFEAGDYGTCQCAECTARRQEDTTWSLRDMALLYPKLFEAATGGREDLWLVCEAYWDNILDPEVLAPLAGLPDEAIYQFCINRSYWPRLRAGLTQEYVARLPRSQNILRTHMGSQWNEERYELVARRFADMAALAHATGLKGMTIFGEVSAFNTVNEINYLAFARFTYNPRLSWEDFVAGDLGPLFGGREEAEKYLSLLTVLSAQKRLNAAVGEAKEISSRLSGEPYRRWAWLQNRLMQKKAMLKENHER
jgi:hypothetical protein